jgi:hypothetical protein
MALKVESGEKRQTIRKIRKRGNPKKGDTLYCYQGLRTKNCQKVGEYTCKEVGPVSIFAGLLKDDKGNIEALANPEVIVAGIKIRNIKSFAKKDGFNSVGEFFNFFYERYGLPFHGILIKW